MKIVIDLQCLQGISRNRGIGRYSLSVAQEILRQAHNHKVYLLFNSTNILEIENIFKMFDNLISQDKIKIFKTPNKISSYYGADFCRIKVAEKIREHYISTLSPDIIYNTSLFEGWIEDIPISVGEFDTQSLTTSTLYDLIPFIYSDIYIKREKGSQFFYEKMQFLKRNHLLITLSESGTQEAINYLAFPKNKIINCSVGLDNKFKKINLKTENRYQLERDYGIKRDFIFYIGAVDFRKNIEGLIKAYLLLPNRENIQLVIIISVNQNMINYFNSFYKEKYKLNENELILISYVSDDILLTLYNACKLFVFPSLHEGFGLPIIEAMACEAPTIGSNTSSIPEAIGCSEALFDPKDPKSIARKINEVLTDNKFSNFLINHARLQSKKFTWQNTAKKILNSFEEIHQENIKKNIFTYKRKKLAYVSPLPPEQSGIASYSSKLVPELGCFYEVVLITEQNTISDLWLESNFQIHNVKWFKKNIDSFDAILYHFGNSSYHHYMIELINTYPGIIVLHDFYISGLLDWISDYIPNKKSYFNQFLFYSHGFPALIYQEKEGRINTHYKYPCNLLILKKAMGVIVHSQYSINLAKKWFGDDLAKKFLLINHLIHQDTNIEDFNKAIFKKELGFKENDFIISCFGNLHPNKLNHRIITSCVDQLIKNKKIYLIFIGEKPYPEYQIRLLALVEKFNLVNQIRFIGFVDNLTFKKFILATDISIQLRTNSRGETSGCLLTCLSYGIPTIANEHGSIKEIPDEIIIKLKDKFLDIELSEAITLLFENKVLREKLSDKAINFVKEKCHPAEIGKDFYNKIEHFIKKSQFSESYLIKKLINDNSSHLKPEELLYFSEIIAGNRQSQTIPQLLLDISYLIDNIKNSQLKKYEKFVRCLIDTSSMKFRPEPIYYNKQKNKFFYAYNYISNLLNISLEINDRPICVYDTDIYLSILPTVDSEECMEVFTKKNIKINLCLFDQIQYQKIFLFQMADYCILFNNKTFYDLELFFIENKIYRHINLKISIINDIDNVSKKLFETIYNKKWHKEIKSSKISTPKIFSVNRDIHINKTIYNFDGDKKYLTNVPEEFDWITLAIFQNFCKKDSFVLDLGANIGLTSIALADICTEGRIAAIEPLEPTFNFLRNNIYKSNKKNISLHQFAVGNKNGEIAMQATQDFLAGAFIADQYQADTKHFTLNVKVNLLDEVFDEFNFNKLDFIKMDLEGYEIFALEGGAKILNKFKPTVFLEMNHWCLNVFHRISLPEFQERLCDIFPYIYAIEYPSYLDFTCKNNFYHIAHEHLTTTAKYFNLIAGFNQLDLINKLEKTMETIYKLSS